MLKLAGTYMEENEAGLRGGAVACEGCKSLNLSGPVGFVENITTDSDDPKGGAIWTDAPLVAKGAKGFSGFPWTFSRFVDNHTATLLPDSASGGAIYATDDVTISKTLFQETVRSARGGRRPLDRGGRAAEGDDRADGLDLRRQLGAWPWRGDQH